MWIFHYTVQGDIVVCMVGAEDGESLQKVDQNRIVRRNHDSDEKLHNSRGQNRLESSRPYIVNKCLHIHNDTVHPYLEKCRHESY